MRFPFPLLLSAGLCAGCTFSREVVNPHVRNIDTAWIEPGRTTRQQIVDRIGFPPTVRGLGGVKKDSFRWTCYDTSNGKLEVGYILTPTFERGTESFAEDILVKFDERDVVTLVSRTRNDGETTRLVEWREAPK